jgi:hypothetical protein
VTFRVGERALDGTYFENGGRNLSGTSLSIHRVVRRRNQKDLAVQLKNHLHRNMPFCNIIFCEGKKVALGVFINSVA